MVVVVVDTVKVDMLMAVEDMVSLTFSYSKWMFLFPGPQGVGRVSVARSKSDRCMLLLG